MIYRILRKKSCTISIQVIGLSIAQKCVHIPSTNVGCSMSLSYAVMSRQALAFLTLKRVHVHVNVALIWMLQKARQSSYQLLSNRHIVSCQPVKLMPFSSTKILRRLRKDLEDTGLRFRPEAARWPLTPVRATGALPTGLTRIIKPVLFIASAREHSGTSLLMVPQCTQIHC